MHTSDPASRLRQRPVRAEFSRATDVCAATAIIPFISIFSIGTVVMQYADPASAAHPSTEALAAPEPMRKDLPQGMRLSGVQIVCILSREGELKNLKVYEPGNSTAEARSKLLAALQNWKFRPAFRGNDPVEVDAMLGFGVDTR